MLGVAHPAAALLSSSAILNTLTEHKMFSTKHEPKYDSTKDARRSVSGCYSGWLAKAKSSDARAKWFTSSTRRFFSIDYDSQIFFYSRSESDKKISQPIGFRDIIGACPLPEGGANTFGFVVRTRNRDYELFAQSEWDAALWVAGLNRARDSADSTASDSTSAGESSASGSSTPSQGSPRSSNPSLDHGPRGPKGGYPEACAVIRERSSSPRREDPFEALEALEAMLGFAADEVPKTTYPPEQSSASQSHQDGDARRVFSQCDTAHVAALALRQHNVEADAWDSDDDGDVEDAVQDGFGCAKGSQVSSIVDFTKNHNVLADVWDSDEEEEEALQEIAESTASINKRPSKKHDGVNEAQSDRRTRKEARREARRMEGETEVEREARRQARRERRSKRSALEQSAVEAEQVEPLQ